MLRCGRILRNLKSILHNELDHEIKTSAVHNVYPHTISFLKENGWTVDHKEGEGEIRVTKTSNDYNLKIFLDACEDVDEQTCVLDITRAGKEGIVTVELDLEEYGIMNVGYYPDQSYAASEEKRDENYAGPLFETLDEKVDDEFHSLLENIGISEELTEKLKDLKMWKEQKEYENWLQKVGDFFQG